MRGRGCSASWCFDGTLVCQVALLVAKRLGSQVAWVCKPSGLGLQAKWLGFTHGCCCLHCIIDALLMYY